MARYHQIEASIWEDMQEYTKEEKLLYIYAFSNPQARDSGLYKISIPTILLNTGLDKSLFEASLKGLKGKLFYDYENKVIFVAGKLKRRLAGFIHNPKAIQGIQYDLDAFKDSSLVSVFIEKYKEVFKGLTSPPLPIPLPLPISKKGDTRGKQERWEKPHPAFMELVKQVCNKK